MSDSSANGTSLLDAIPGQVYLVGGAVRDALLGLPVRERDWVVVGATAAQLQQLGFRRVGRDFPVFLHPQTGEEYALARQERKTAAGYRGFDIDAAPTVTLEQDLGRRDLTINAIAQSADGSYVDPYNGRGDLANATLRHVSPAFSEDPVRLLRTARFAARFAARGFHIAAQTQALLREMAASGELDALVPERVWRELTLALPSTRPAVFFESLLAVGALEPVLPELTGLASRDEDWRAGLAALDRGAAAGLEATGLFACLTQRLAAEQLAALCTRLRAPRAFRDAARALNELFGELHRLPDAAAACALLERLDALRRPQRLEGFLAAASALDPDTASLAQRLTRLREIVAAVSTAPLQAQGLQGLDLAHELRARRLAAARENWNG